MPPKGGTVDPIRLSVAVDLDNANDKIKSQIGTLNKTVTAFAGTMTRSLASIAAGGAIGAIAGLGAAMVLTVGAASKFEDSFAGIKKTVDASESEFKRLGASIRELATEIPIATSQLNQIGELGGQLGVTTGGLPIFIETIAQLGVATRLSTETAALSLARLQTIFQLPEQSVSNLASSLVDLGNNFAALEDEILSTSLRLAAGAKVAGATVADTLAIATALQAVGVQSQAGGTAMARVFQAITMAVQGGQKELQVFSQLTGMTTQEFKEFAMQDPAKALNAFLAGLSAAGKEGRNLVNILEELGLKQQRTIRALLAVAEAGDLLTDTLNTANIAYDLNIALQEEANKRFETAKSQTKLMKNAFTELRIEMGNYFLPALKNILAGMYGLADSMQNTDKAQEGMSKGLGLTVGIMGTLGAAVMFLIPGFVGLKISALQAEQGLVQYARAAKAADLASKEYILTQQLAARASGFLLKNIGLLTTGLVALSAAFIINQAANTKARRASEAYNKSVSVAVPLREKLLKSQQRIDELKSPEIVNDYTKKLTTNSIAVQQAVKENEALAEALEKVELASARAFLNIPKFKVDLGVEETESAVSDFNKAISEYDQGLEILNQLGIERPEESLSDILVKSFAISDEDAQKIVEGGFSSIVEFLTVASMENEDAFSIFAQYLTSFGGMIAQEAEKAARAPEKYTQTQRDFLNNQREFFDNYMELASRIGSVDTEQEFIAQGRMDMLDSYNELAEKTEGLDTISQTEFQMIPESALLVFQAVNGQLDTMEKEVDNVADVAKQDMLTAFEDVLEKVTSIVGTVDDFEAPEIIDVDSIREGVQLASDLQTVLQTGIFKVLEAGYPALALSFANGGIEAKNLGMLIALINDGLENNTDILVAMEEDLVNKQEEYAQYADATEETISDVTNELETQYGIVGSITDKEEQRAAVNRVLGAMSKEVKNEGADYLDILKDIINDERQRIELEQDIADITQEISDMQADLVYDNITITNAKRDEVEKTTALAELNAVIAEYGAEGVKTASENLNILQMELNISRMKDQLENKMDARRKKALRDKQKEVKFLEMAVEQGVVDQLDLDAAREELSEMQNPMTQKEIDILTLQKQIAEAELQAAKARAEGLAPEVISAIENYNSALKVTKDRENEIAEKTEEVERKKADLNIQLAETALKYQEIADKFPGFKEKVTEIATMIGIPDEMLSKALTNMGTTIDEYVKYVDFAKKYTDQVMSGNADPNSLYNNNKSSYENAASEALKKFREGEKSVYGAFDPSNTSNPFNIPSSGLFSDQLRNSLSNVPEFKVDVPTNPPPSTPGYGGSDTYGYGTNPTNYGTNPTTYGPDGTAYPGNTYSFPGNPIYKPPTTPAFNYGTNPTNYGPDGQVYPGNTYSIPVPSSSVGSGYYGDKDTQQKFNYGTNPTTYGPDGQVYPGNTYSIPAGGYNPGESFVIQDAVSGAVNSISDKVGNLRGPDWDKVLKIQNSFMGRAYGGSVPIGRASVVGEMGPEVIMPTPSGTSVFANKTGGYGSGVNIENMNLNITGLPADPITARKVAQNIRKELLKLEKEGQAGTGLVNR